MSYFSIPTFFNGGYIADVNGNELLIFSVTANAMNELTLANAASGSSPTLSMTGGGTDIGLNINPKGAGAITLTSGVTTGSGLAITSSTLSTGKLLSLASTSTTYGTQYGLDVSLTGSYNSSAYTSYGVNVVNSRYGSYGSCTTYGALFTVSTVGTYSNTHYGVSSVVSNYSSGSGTNYGFHTSLTNCGSSSTNYGVYSSVSSTATTNYAGWFSAGSGTTNWAIYVSAGDVGTALSTLNCFNTTATTVNAFGAATAINIGAAATAGIVTIGKAADSTGYLNVVNTLDTTSSTTGAIKTAGGIAAAKGLTVGTNIKLPTTTASAGIIYQNGTRLMHTYGTNNMFVGVGSGNFTLSGSYNVGIGAACLDEITSGQFNVGFGYNTLSKVSSGTNNTGVGNNTLELVSTHNDNTAIGSAAMYQTVGSGNVAIGTHAGRALTGTQTNCTWIGHYSGFTGTTGGLTNATVLGYNVQATASNSVVIGNTSVSATQLAGNVTIIAAGGSGNLKVPGSIEIGHATDTTLARVSAGLLSVEGVQLARLGDSLWQVGRLRQMGAYLFGSSGGSAAVNYVAGGCSVNSGTAANNYGRATLYRGVNRATGATGGGIGFGMDMAVAAVLSIDHSISTAARVRLVIGANGGVPATADNDAISVRGFGVEFRWLSGTACECQIFAHDGTTYSVGGWSGVSCGSYDTLTSLVITSDGLGEIKLYITGGANGQPGVPVLVDTMSGGPTANSTSAGAYIDLVAVCPSTAGPHTAGAAVLWDAYLDNNPF